MFVSRAVTAVGLHVERFKKSLSWLRVKFPVSWSPCREFFKKSLAWLFGCDVR